MNIDSPEDPEIHEVQWRELDELLLDSHNSRFGDLQKGRSQRELVRLIVEKFGIEDVLSSIAANGFFFSEPLMCMRGEDGKLVAKEGNRRLCACIVLANDPRAVDVQEHVERARLLWEHCGKQKFLPVPVLEYSEASADFSRMQSYLGVRHIAAAQPWDSYAKAAWIANAVDRQELPVTRISQMIGDRYQTVVRLLEGYRFVNQLIESRLFDPQDSIRSGRGTVVEYPFSWIYTILGFTAARDFTGLMEFTGDPRPIPDEKLENAQTVVVAMFGSKSKGRSSVISESRELSTLANALSNPEKASQIRLGKNLADIELMCKPIDRKLEDNLEEARRLLSGLVPGLSESPLESSVAGQHVLPATKVHRLSARVRDDLRGLAGIRGR